MEFYGLLGEKLGHSLSPCIHQMAFSYLGLTGAYKLLPVEREKIGEAVKAIKLLGIKGVNVTIPYKQIIMEQLDGLSTEAEKIGAVNTLALQGDKLIGYNTDYDGFAGLLNYYGITTAGRKAAVLGTGGVAQAILAVLLDGGIETVYLVTRDKKIFIPARKPLDDRIQVVDYRELSGIRGDILINATPLGMWPAVEDSPVADEICNNFEILVDTVYNPLETKFLAAGRSRGKQVCGGLYMLAAQAMRSQEIWQGQKVPTEITEKIYLTLLQERARPKICLIGMPGCGKTTLGQMLAARLGRDFIDMDRYIEQIAGSSIPELFTQGEDNFRRFETQACRRLASVNNAVVACGGGVVLKKENLEWLQKDGGILIFIDRPLENIAKDVHTDSRPLLKDNPARLKTLYEQRYPLYLQATSWQVKNTGRLQEVLKQLQAVIEQIEGSKQR